jgi:hypothetical protein
MISLDSSMIFYPPSKNISSFADERLAGMIDALEIGKIRHSELDRAVRLELAFCKYDV